MKISGNVSCKIPTFVSLDIVLGQDKQRSSEGHRKVQQLRQNPWRRLLGSTKKKKKKTR
jgi:hypothetical protein